MSIWEIFNDVFWISIGTTFFAFMGVVIKTALKSKCDETNLCFGLIKIHRRVELENEDDENRGGANIPEKKT